MVCLSLADRLLIYNFVVMITQQELLTLFSMGTCVRTSDKFLIHTSTGRLLEVSAEAVRAYLKKDFNGVLSVDDEGYVTINDERTGYQLQPVNITDLQTRMDGLEQDIKDITLSGAGCQCSDMGERLTVPTADTQIKVKHGDEMKHITLGDIKTFLAPEYAPRWTDATCSISCTKAGVSTTMEVGSAKPLASDFTSSGSAASAVSVAGTANGGSLDEGNSGISIITSTDASFVAKATRVYTAGTTQVKSSKGTPTNKTAANSNTELASASVNSNIDASTFVIKSMTKTAQYAISYMNYRYRGEISSLPSTDAEVLSAIQGASREFSHAGTLGATNLAKNKYYIFAVVGNHNLEIRENSVNALVDAAKKGTISVPRVNGSGNDTYSYIIVPASVAMAWVFRIEKAS